MNDSVFFEQTYRGEISPDFEMPVCKIYDFYRGLRATGKSEYEALVEADTFARKEYGYTGEPYYKGVKKIKVNSESKVVSGDISYNDWFIKNFSSKEKEKEFYEELLAAGFGK